ncbi:MAG: VanW family protein [Candidatus Falkowbacteria bacterium]|nr:VanW family protein [Candidatus Falkowbacteria bacterium]
MEELEREIGKRIKYFETKKRTALSGRYPKLKKPIIFLRHQSRGLNNFLNPKIKYLRGQAFFDFVVARHQSVLRRKLGNSDFRLQEQKIVNLRQAVGKLNGVVISPGCIFSLWQIVGKPSRKNGYVDGMLLSGGKVVEGVGGGLCQLSNFLYWIFLHAPFETIERYHHSLDVFPDSGRVLPFGSGATILYNFVDLKMKNTSNKPLQLKIWLTDNHLKGQILSPEKIEQKFHVFEKNHFFIKRGDKYFRYNEIFQESKVLGEKQKIKKITSNFAPVLYDVKQEYLDDNQLSVLDFTSRKV